MDPESLDEFFPATRQRYYVSMFQKREGLTRRRAEYFVRLWAYLILKEREELDGKPPAPIVRLYPLRGAVSCTLREAAAVFYSDDQGSDRAASSMLDCLVELGLLDKEFDGQTLCFHVRFIPELSTSPQAPPQAEPLIKLFTDSFNPRTDAVSVANLLTRTHVEIFKDVDDA